MTRVILEHLMHLMLVLPIILFTMKDRKPEHLKVVLAFLIFFILDTVLLYLPLEFDQLRIIDGKWNWTGKIFAILGAVLFLLVYRKFELKDYFLTLKQKNKGVKIGLIIISIILAAEIIMSIVYGRSREWNTDSILYQLTMPGLNEEIAYRGIMLGLLVKILKPNRILHPAILVTAILFGMAHGLLLNSNFEIIFKSQYFFQTMILGIIWGWITLKTGSILLALISHNLGNTAGKLISMIR